MVITPKRMLDMQKSLKVQDLTALSMYGIDKKCHSLDIIINFLPISFCAIGF